MNPGAAISLDGLDRRSAQMPDLRKPPCLAPPQAVIDVARRTMGAIDLHVGGDAQTIRLSEAVVQLPAGDLVRGSQLPAAGKGRALLAATGGTRKARLLAGLLLDAYRSSRVKEAVIWCGGSEILPRCPWLWDFPICIPFRRLAPQFWDDELEEFARVAPSAWSPIIYLPPAAPREAFIRGLARFHAAAGVFGRVVFDERSGDSPWRDAYRSLTGRSYSDD